MIYFNFKFFLFLFAFMLVFMLIIIANNNYDQLFFALTPKTFSAKAPEISTTKATEISSAKAPEISIKATEPYFEYLFWKEILEASDEQLLMNKSVLFKTFKFMLTETQQDDPKLLEFVKSLIVPPSNEKLNLQNPGLADYSQSGQSQYIDQILKSKHNGFLVEAGAFDGEFQSNSIFFETQRNWSGILIEPIPSFYRSVLAKNRKLHKINVCIAKNKPTISKFRVHSVYSGRDNVLYESHKKLIGNQAKFLYVPCFSLYTILKAINISKVEFFSLDVEGGEYDVLTGLDFDRLDITTFLIEHSNDLVTKPLISKLMQGKNYTLVADKVLDFFYKKNNNS